MITKSKVIKLVITSESFLVSFSPTVRTLDTTSILSTKFLMPYFITGIKKQRRGMEIVTDYFLELQNHCGQ